MLRRTVRLKRGRLLSQEKEMLTEGPPIFEPLLRALDSEAWAGIKGRDTAQVLCAQSGERAREPFPMHQSLVPSRLTRGTQQ